MANHSGKTVLILGANSDVAKEAIKLYLERGCQVFAASRNTAELDRFLNELAVPEGQIQVFSFDATAFETHQKFYEALPAKPHIVLYAAGFLVSNEEALVNWEGAYQMMKVNYAGAVSFINVVATDADNDRLERIIGISSLSGVRGRKSNFIYGSTKSAFTQYLAGLRQYLSARKVVVNVIVSGYIRTKINAGLDLPESLLLEPEYVAKDILQAGNSFVIVPGMKWKAIYQVLKRLPESLVAKLP